MALAVPDLREAQRYRRATPQEVQQYRPGSESDFDLLYRASYGKVVGTLMGILRGDRALAEDCAQDAFVQAFRAWGRWRPDAPAEAWVMRIAINVAISQGRRRRLRQVGEVIRRLGRPEPGADPSELATGPLVAALGRLKPAERAVIILRHHHGYTNREIAVALHRPESTISARLVAAKERLRAALELERAFVIPGESRVIS